MKSIINARKRGEPISHLFRIKEANSPYLDEMINFYDILRICRDAHCPFRLEEIIRLFNKIYNKKYHGSKKASLNWAKRFLIPPKENTFSHTDLKKLGDSERYFNSDEENTTQNEKCAKREGI